MAEDEVEGKAVEGALGPTAVFRAQMLHATILDVRDAEAAYATARRSVGEALREEERAGAALRVAMTARDQRLARLLRCAPGTVAADLAKRAAWLSDLPRDPDEGVVDALERERFERGAPVLESDVAPGMPGPPVDFDFEP